MARAGSARATILPQARAPVNSKNKQKREAVFVQTAS